MLLWRFKRPIATDEEYLELNTRVNNLKKEINLLSSRFHIDLNLPPEQVTVDRLLISDNLEVQDTSHMYHAPDGSGEDSEYVVSSSRTIKTGLVFLLSSNNGSVSLFRWGFSESEGDKAKIQEMRQKLKESGVVPEQARAAWESFKQNYDENFKIVKEKSDEVKRLEREMDAFKERVDFTSTVYVFAPGSKEAELLQATGSISESVLETYKTRDDLLRVTITRETIQEQMSVVSRFADEILGSWRYPSYEQFGLSDAEAGHLRSKVNEVRRFLDKSSDSLDLVSAWATVNNLIGVFQNLRRGVKPVVVKSEAKPLVSPKTLEEKYGAPPKVVEIKKATFKETGGRWFQCSCNNQTRISKEDYAAYKDGKTITIECGLCKGVGDVHL